MKHQLIFIAGVLFLMFSACTNETTFYVSPNGDDSQSGKSAETPFATLEKACDAIRELKMKGVLKSPITVYLRGGIYQLSEPFILKNEDSGTNEFPVTYRTMENEKPIIRNNIFAFARTSVVMMAKIQAHTTFILTNNILLSDGTPIYAGGYEYNVEQKVAFKADSNLVWSTAGKVIGAQNRFPSRIYEPNEPVLTWERWLELGNDQHSIIADPGFKDLANGDFSLAENSPALKVGFKPFALNQAGPR